MVFAGITDTRFEIHGLIGAGGCGAIHRAFDRETSRWVALKILTDADPSARPRFEREARAARSFNHPNVCAAYACGELDDGRPYLAMELLEGQSLRHYLDRHGRLDAETAIEIAVQLLSGLEVTHARGLVHRDVKPENIFLVLGTDGRVTVKVLDFGLCRSETDAFDGKTLTEHGTLVGTPGYMAPEQLGVHRANDARVDIFTAGLVLFEMLTGRRAYRGASIVQTITRLLREDVPTLRSVIPSAPLALEHVLERATSRNPAARYQTVAVFLHELLSARTKIRVAVRPRAYASAHR